MQGVKMNNTRLAVRPKDFLKELLDGSNGYMDIRAIDPYGNKKNKKEFLSKDELEYWEPLKGCDIYMGVRPRKDKIKPGNAENTMPSSWIWADYDNLQGDNAEQKYRALQVRLKGAGVPQPAIVVNSGNGLHSYWKMDEPINEPKDILIRLCELTGADVSCTDNARILRVPGTFNLKDTNNPKAVEIIEYDTSLIYPLEYFIGSIGLTGWTDKAKTLESEIEPASNKELKGLIENLNILPCTRSMINNGVTQGHRNFALGRITKDLQRVGLTRKRALQIVLTWNMNNKPMESESKVRNDFNSYWTEDYKLLGCNLDVPENKLEIRKQQAFLDTYCDKEKCVKYGMISNLYFDNAIYVDNRIFDYYKKITGNEIAVYGVLQRHRQGLDIDQLMEKLTARATKKPIATKKTIRKYLDNLISLGLIESYKGNRKMGVNDIYKFKPQGTFGMGYTLVTNGAINGLIDGRSTSGEFKVYVLLMKFAFGKHTAYPSLGELARYMGTSKNSLSMQLKSLEENDYLIKEIKSSNGIDRTSYKLIL